MSVLKEGKNPFLRTDNSKICKNYLFNLISDNTGKWSDGNFP